jgi:hypothetical protein
MRSFLCLVISAAPAAAGSVWIVRPDGTGDFTEIQSAIDASAERDLILVGSGTYPAFIVIDKSVTIVADSSAAVVVTGTSLVRDLALGKTCVLSGLSCEGVASLPGVTASALAVANCAGSVRVQRCTLRGAEIPACGIPATPVEWVNGGPALDVNASADVAVTNSVLLGGASDSNGDFTQGNGGSGADCTNSRLALFDNDVRGGPGRVPSCIDGGNGGAGIRLFTAELFASFSPPRGGDGAPSAQTGGCAYGGDGANGIQLFTGSVAALTSSVPLNGTGGLGHPNLGCSPTVANGVTPPPTFVSFDSTLTTASYVGKRMVFPAQVREGDVFTATFQGQLHDHVLLFLSHNGGYEPLQPGNGVRLVGRPFRTISLGLLASTPTLSLQFTAPVLPSADEGITIQIQALFVAPGAIARAGPCTSLVVLDSSL